MNVLILSAGRRVSLVRGFMDAMKEYGGSVFTADLNPELSAACQIADRHIKLPHCQSPEFTDELLSVCKSENISLVIPTIDTELLLLSASRAGFAQAGIELLISNEKIISLCRDKRLTGEFFESIGLQTPALYSKDELKFPVLVKPYDGSLSSGVVLVNDRNGLTQEILDNPKNMYCQYIDHEDHNEFTIDMYFDKDSQLRCVVPRKRLEVRGGEVSKGMTEKNELVEILFDVFSQVEGIRGCVNLQVFRHQKTGDCWSIELNPRFGGGYPLTRLSGATFEQWIVDEYIGGKKIEKYNDWKDRLIMLRYDDEVIVNG